MNILFITHYSSLYGANRSLMNLIEKLQLKPNVNIVVLLPEDGDLTKWLKINKIEYKIIGFASASHTYPKEHKFLKNIKTWLYIERQTIYKIFLNIKSYFEILPIIKKHKINIIYSNSSVVVIGFFLRYFTTFNLKYVLHIRELQKEQYNLLPDWGNKLFNVFLKTNDLTITVSNFVKEYLNTSTSAIVVYNGVFSYHEVQQFNNIKKITNSNHLLKFGIIGLIHPIKGQKLVLKSFHQLLLQGYNAELLIAGEGNSKELIEYIEKHNLNHNVKLMGYVENPIEFYKQIDVAIIASKYEAMGRVTVEPMLLNIITLGLKHGATQELIDNDNTGFLFDEKEEDLTNLMIKILKMTPEKRYEITQKAYQFAIQNFTTEHYANQVYQNLLTLK